MLGLRGSQSPEMTTPSPRLSEKKDPGATTLLLLRPYTSVLYTEVRLYCEGVRERYPFYSYSTLTLYSYSTPTPHLGSFVQHCAGSLYARKQSKVRNLSSYRTVEGWYSTALLVFYCTSTHQSEARLPRRQQVPSASFLSRFLKAGGRLELADDSRDTFYWRK